MLTGGRRERGSAPHPPLRGPPVSLRLGHTRALSLHRSEIQSPRAASLPAEEGKNRRGANMPSPVGEGGSRRLTDEAFFPRSSFYAFLLIHRSAVPLLRQEKAKVRSGG